MARAEPDPSSRARGAPVAASVCIAAYNEAHGIETAVRSALSQRCAGRLEVLVCANGCSDSTADAARMIARKDSRVRVFETPVRGKPNAWNILRENASGRVLYFMDADVFAVEGAFEALARALRDDPRIVAAGARRMPVNLNRDHLSRMMAPPGGPSTCLNGGLYAVDASRLSERLRERGIARMPLDVICEDLWLTMVIGKRRWIEVAQALVLYLLPRFDEQVLTGQRIKWGLRQLQREYGALHREFGRTRVNRLRVWAIRAARAGSPSGLLCMVVGAALIRLAVLCTTGISANGPWLRKWRSAPSSKRLVPLLPAYAVRIGLVARASLVVTAPLGGAAPRLHGSTQSHGSKLPASRSLGHR